MYWPKCCIAPALFVVLGLGCSKTDPSTYHRTDDEAVMLEESHEHYHVHSPDVTHEHQHSQEEFTGHGHEHTHSDDESQEQDEEHSPEQSAAASTP